MATLRSTKGGVLTPSASSGWANSVQRAYGIYEHTSSPAAGDVVVMCKLPKGALIVGGAVKGDKLDSAGSGSSLASINIGLNAAVVDLAGTTVSASSTSNCLVASLNLGPDTAAVTGYKIDSGVRNIPFGSVLLTNGPLLTTDETEVRVTWTASSLAFTTGTMIVEVDYVVVAHS
jgi:hypothetical protein